MSVDQIFQLWTVRNCNNLSSSAREINFCIAHQKGSFRYKSNKLIHVTGGHNSSVYFEWLILHAMTSYWACDVRTDMTLVRQRNNRPVLVMLWWFTLDVFELHHARLILRVVSWSQRGVQRYIWSYWRQYIFSCWQLLYLTSVWGPISVLVHYSSYAITVLISTGVGIVSICDSWCCSYPLPSTIF